MDWVVLEGDRLFAIEQKGLENFLWLRQGFNAKASPKLGSIVEFLELQVRVREQRALRSP